MSELEDPAYYKPGEVVYSEEPFIRVIRQDLWNKICAGCLKNDSPLKMCAACGKMKYCGKICQKKAWKDHKIECPYLRNFTHCADQDVQMLGNTILKIKGKDWKTITMKAMGKEVSFDDLVSHADSEHDRSRLSSYIGLLKGPLITYIGKENLPDDDKILCEILGKILHNRFEFSQQTSEIFNVEDEDDRPYGSCLFIGASKFDHSCVPNSQNKITGLSIVFRAIKPVHKQLDKITISYRSMISELESFIKLENKKQSFGNQCYCEDCSQPFGKSALTKIIDESQAPYVIKETKDTLEMVTGRSLYSGSIDSEGLQAMNRLLKLQKGVLGNTNLLRMQTLALRNLFTPPTVKMLKELTQLTDSMVEVWGEYNPELRSIYMRLIKIHMDLNNYEKAFEYAKKNCMMRTICWGTQFHDVDGYAAMICNLIHQNIMSVD